MMKQFFILMIGLLLALSTKAATVYVSQSGGVFSGGVLCNGHTAITPGSISWVAGNTYILCGTFTGTANASPIISIGGSGTSGNPITLLFDTGTVLTAPYWGNVGAIYGTGVSNIVVDGGVNGIIRNTANGSMLANNTTSYGINFRGATGVEVRNLTIGPIYVCNSSASCDPGDETYGIRLLGSGTGLNIHNNTFHDAHWCALGGPEPSSTVTNIQFYNNISYNCDHGLAMSSNPGSTTNGVLMHDNEMYDGGIWDEASTNYHHDGMHIWADQSGETITGTMVYNNYCHGNWGNPSISSFQACIFTEASGGGVQNGVQVFNNVFAVGTGVSQNGIITVDGNNSVIYNNTVIGNTTTSNGTGQDALIMTRGTNDCIQNNILSTSATGISVNTGSTLAATCNGTQGSNNNILYNMSSNSSMIYGSTQYNTVAQWKSGTGFDANSPVTSPNLNASYVPNAGSPAIGAALNLTSLGITALDSDKAGVARLLTGSWDSGAYQDPAQSAGGPPNAPSGLTATVN